MNNCCWHLSLLPFCYLIVTSCRRCHRCHFILVVACRRHLHWPRSCHYHRCHRFHLILLVAVAIAATPLNYHCCSWLLCCCFWADDHQARHRLTDADARIETHLLARCLRYLSARAGGTLYCVTFDGKLKGYCGATGWADNNYFCDFFAKLFTHNYSTHSPK